jgi:hypothetical protein
MASLGRSGVVAWLLLCWVGLAWPAAESGDPQQGLLFAFERDEGPPSYLFGTIHFGDPRVLDLPAPVAQAFASARRLVLEVTPDAPTLLEAAAGTMLPPGDDLESLLGTDLYREVVAAAQRRQVPALVVARLKPWAVATLLSLPLTDQERVLDLTLYRRALARGLPVSGLESAAEQLAAFETLSRAQQIALLREVLRNEAHMPNQYRELVDAYLSRDLATLARLGEEAMGPGSGHDAFGQALVGERNQRMAERIEQLAGDGGGLFVAVGALHLPGDAGLVQLLRRRGFDVRLIH